MELFPVQRYLGGEKEIKSNDDTNLKMCKLFSKIKKRSKLMDLADPFEKLEENDRPSTSAIPKSEVSLEIVKGEPKERKRKKEKCSTSVKVADEKPVENENGMISHSLENEMEKLKVNSSNETNGRLENYNQDENVTASTSFAEVFPVIGDYEFKKKNKVKRVLPDWLANPSVVSVDLKNLEKSIHDIPALHKNFVDALEKNKITHFFPVQAQVIPQLLSSSSSVFWPSDICVSAPTGSGKTLAYVLPILQALMNKSIGHIQALVVLPVQELAAQVASVFRTYSAGARVKVHLSTGGVPLKEDRAGLVRPMPVIGWDFLIDILVTTPGRLVEHLYSTPGFSLKHLKYIVIDEADRVVDNMQNNWLHHLDKHLSVQGSPLLTVHNLKTLPRRPQRLLFSATLSTDPEKLNQLNLFQPRLFTSVVEANKDKEAEWEFIGKFTTPAELEEHMVRCVLAVKPLVLYQLISRDCWSRVLVFTASSRSVHQLSSLLALLAEKMHHPLRVAEISAECSHKKRETVLSDFTAGCIDVLVSTDALARGMDIPNVQYVISYDMPKYIKAYIHRVGRTGRAGQHGVAVTLVQHSQVGLFQQMLQTAGKEESVLQVEVTEEELKALEEPFKEALIELKEVTKSEELNKLKKIKSMKRASLANLLSKKRKKKNNIGKNTKKLKGEEAKSSKEQD